MSKGIDELKDWAMHNVRLISILPSNKNLQVDTKLSDVLEKSVDEKYFLSEERTSQLLKEFPLTAQDRHGIAIREETGINQGVVINPLKDKTNSGWHFEQQVYDPKGITRAVKAGGGSGNIPKTFEGFRIRKLTPLECFRLQGFTDEQFYKAKNDGVSNSQLYKQAGNSVTVNVIDAIARKLT